MKKPKQYNLTPAKGQALLNFQGRRYPDKVDVFETELIEEIRSSKIKKQTLFDKETELNADFNNLLIQGDCLSACAYLKQENIKVDLVYIDPPFASGANYAKKLYLRNGKESQMEAAENAIGEEVMYGDIWQKEDYLNWLYERLLAIKDIMRETGVIYLHLDHTIGFYAKVIMDEVFGEDGFLNTISWRCQVARGMKAYSRYYPYSTQYLHIYSKSADKNKIVWNLQKNVNKITKEEAENNYMNDENGYFRTSDPGSYSYEKLLELNKESRIYISRGGKLKIDEERKQITTTKGTIGIKYYLKKQGKYYLEEKAVDNLWDDVPGLGTVPSEDVNYATQKTEALLKRVIEASSDEGMIVADFFSGSGTTAKVANDLNRKFIACDIGINAVQTTRDRLVEAGADFDVLKVKDGLRLFRNPAQTTAKIFNIIDGFKSRKELSLSKFWDGGIAQSKGSYAPVKFSGIHDKLTKELLDVYLEEIYKLEDVSNEACEVIIIYAHKDIDVEQNYVNKQLKKTAKTELKIKLVSLDDLLGEKRDALFTPDNADIEVSKQGNKYKVEIKKFFSPYLKNKIDDYNAKKTKKGTTEQDLSKAVKISESGLELIEAVQFDTRLNDVWQSNPDLEDKASIKEKIKGVYTLDTDKFRMKIRNIAGDEIVIDSDDINNY